MSTRITQGSLIIPKENLEIHSKKATEDGKIKSSKAAAKKGGAALGKATEDGKIKSSKATAKKGGAALGSRKALNDITNKSFLHQETSSKKELPEEDINVAEEGFLHDHKKCIEAQQISMHALDLNLVLPGHDEFKSKSTNPLPEPEKMDFTSLDLEELLMPESNWWSKTSVKQISPPSSPLYWESTSLYASVFEFEDVEFELRPESEV